MGFGERPLGVAIDLADHSADVCSSHISNEDQRHKPHQSSNQQPGEEGRQTIGAGGRGRRKWRRVDMEEGRGGEERVDGRMGDNPVQKGKGGVR